MQLHETQIVGFRQALFEYYSSNARHTLPWRQPCEDGVFDAYHIWVSEIMLQQTQVGRVIPKYLDFIARFPDIPSLASATLGDVLVAWQGLGYNRRAKFLWEAARLVDASGGVLPTTIEELVALPGIGRNTAGAIVAYAYNKPTLFIETNIRSVYFHHFFADMTDIPDKEIIELLAQTIDEQNPREFYWALMDYGSHLKKQGNGRLSQSKHYVKQGRFEGSTRQLRGKILRLLTHGAMEKAVILEQLADERALTVLEQLIEERMVATSDDKYQLA